MQKQLHSSSKLHLKTKTAHKFYYEHINSDHFQMFCDIILCVRLIHFFNIVSSAVIDFLYQDLYMLRILLTDH